MRLQAHIWVSAFLRAQQARGAFATIAVHGAEEAGVIFIVHNHLDGTFSLFGPAPQSAHNDGLPDRSFEQLAERETEAAIQQRIDSQRRFDPDRWVVEIRKPGRQTCDSDGQEIRTRRISQPLISTCMAAGNKSPFGSAGLCFPCGEDFLLARFEQARQAV